MIVLHEDIACFGRGQKTAWVASWVKAVSKPDTIPGIRRLVQSQKSILVVSANMHNRQGIFGRGVDFAQERMYEDEELRKSV